MRRTVLRLVLALAGRGPCTGYDGGTCTVPGDRDHRQKGWGYRGVSVPVDWRSRVLTLQQCSDLDCLADYLALRRVLLHCNTIHVMSTFAFIGQTDHDRLIVVHGHRLIFLTKLQHDSS